MKRFLTFLVKHIVQSPLAAALAFFSLLWALCCLEWAWHCPWGNVSPLPAGGFPLVAALFILGILTELSSCFAIHAAALSVGGTGPFKRFWTDHLLATSLSLPVLWAWPWWSSAPGLFIAVWSGFLFIAVNGVYQLEDNRSLRVWLYSLPMQLVSFIIVGLLAFSTTGWRHKVWQQRIARAEKENAAGQNAQAETDFQSALALAIKIGPQSSDAAQSWYELGFLYQLEGRYVEAEQAMRRAAPIFRRLYGVNGRPYWDCVVRLAEIAEQSGHYSQAEAFYRDLLGTMEHQLGSKHPFEIGYFNALARLAYVQERYNDAEGYYSRALVIAESIPADTPTSPTDFRITLVNSLAYTYSAEGKFDDLRRLMESHPGFDPPSVYQQRLWDQLKKLADNTATRDPAYADKLLRRCLIIAHGMGPHDPHNHLTREALARLHAKS